MSDKPTDDQAPSLLQLPSVIEELRKRVDQLEDALEKHIRLMRGLVDKIENATLDTYSQM